MAKLEKYNCHFGTYNISTKRKTKSGNSSSQLQYQSTVSERSEYVTSIKCNIVLQNNFVNVLFYRAERSPMQ